MSTESSTLERTSPTYKFVPKDFSGRLRADLTNVFHNDDGTYSFCFIVTEPGPFSGMRSKTYLNLQHPKRAAYYAKVFSEFGEELTEENVSALVGRTFELEYTMSMQDDESYRQNIWLHRCMDETVPAVNVEVDGRQLCVRFDSISDSLPRKGKEGFKVWLALRAWSKAEMMKSGWPSGGRFVYPFALKTAA